MLLCALIVKLRKNKTKFKHKKQSKSLRPSPLSSSRIFGLIAILMMVVGFGGMMSKVFNSEATNFGEEGILTSGTVYASLVDTGSDYNLYCATDEVKTNATDYGYYLFMSAKDKGALTSQSSGINNITSAEDWDGLDLGQWGYVIGDNTTYNPLPHAQGVIGNIDERTGISTTNVTYCAKISKDITTANFSTTIDYSFFPREEGDFYPSIDFNSAEDSDSDGLPNREENRYGLNPLSSDSDMDSLSDYSELKTHHTDPLSKDTDEDGLYDYSEIALGSAYSTDPNNPKSNGTDLDGDRTYTYSEEANDTTDFAFTIEGTGNIPLTYISAVDPVDIDEGLSDLTGKAYVFDSAGDVTNATLTVPYATESEVEALSEESDQEENFSGVTVDETPTTASDLYAISVTYDMDSAEIGDEVEPTLTDTIKTIDTTNGTITLSISDSSTTIFVGSDTEANSNIIGEEDYGGLISRLFTRIKTKLKEINDRFMKGYVSFFDNLGNKLYKVTCGITGGVWNEDTNTCTKKKAYICEQKGGYWDAEKSYCYTEDEVSCIQNGDTWDNDAGRCYLRDTSYDWFVNTEFKMGTNGDQYKNSNFTSYYDKDNKHLMLGGGNCQSIASVVRLLYLDKINLDIKHQMPLGDNDFMTFDFRGMTKEQLLNEESKDVDLSTVEVKTVDAADGKGFNGYGFALTDMPLARLIAYMQRSFPYKALDAVAISPNQEELERLWNGYISGEKEKIDKLAEDCSKGITDWGLVNGLWKEVSACDYMSESKWALYNAESYEDYIAKNLITVDDFVNDMKDKVDADDPIVLSIGEYYQLGMGGHSVNLISMGKVTNENSDVQKFEFHIYDNNYPNAYRNIFDVECSKISCTAKTGLGVIPIEGGTIYVPGKFKYSVSADLHYLLFRNDDYFLTH